ncbi:hypothetical protein AOLI_G00120110 [Acnodon oligacanthus]
MTKISNIVFFFSVEVGVFSALFIQQSPLDALKTPDQREVIFSCRHGDTSYPYMYWYQQKNGFIQLIGMLHYERAMPEDGFKARFNVSGHSKDFTSHIYNGTPNIAFPHYTPLDDRYLLKLRNHSAHCSLQGSRKKFTLILSIGTMFEGLCRLYILLGGLSSLSYCILVEQPSDLIVKPADDVNISCSHNEEDKDVMLWYQQRRDPLALALISYNYATAPPNHEPEFTDRFKHSRLDTLKGDLIISNLSISDSAVYFCAVRRHSAVVLSVT